MGCLISPLRTIGNRTVTCCDGGVPIDPATLMCQSCKDDPAMGMPTATGDMPGGEISLHPLEKWQVEILDQLIVLPKARVCNHVNPPDRPTSEILIDKHAAEKLQAELEAMAAQEAQDYQFALRLAGHDPIEQSNESHRKPSVVPSKPVIVIDAMNVMFSEPWGYRCPTIDYDTHHRHNQ